jgi:hypothetical protein
LEEQYRAELAALARLEQEINTRRQKGARNADEAGASRKQVDRLTAELARMEQALAALRAVRQQARQTYSVVPYRGPRGDKRRPIYVECATAGVVFHPEHLTLAGSEVSRLALRAEIERRLAALGPVKETEQKEERAYLLLLVRPDGIMNFYHTKEALNGLPVAFGYELIDADWVLDFPKDEPPVSASPVANGTAGSAVKPVPKGVAFGAGPSRESGTQVSPGPGESARPEPGASGVGPAVVRLPGPPLVGGNGPGKESGPLQGTRPSPEARGNRQVGERGNATGNVPSGGSSRAAAAGAAPTAGTVPPMQESQAGQEKQASGTRTEVGGGAAPESGGSPERDGGKPPPRTVRLTGGRDWIIQVECTADAVIVHPTRLRVPVTALKGSRGTDNPLRQAVQQMIDRRQASIRPGEPTYRPQVRFLVRPDGLRTFHQVYPMLEPLRLPMTRQDLAPGEEVRAP